MTYIAADQIAGSVLGQRLLQFLDVRAEDVVDILGIELLLLFGVLLGVRMATGDHQVLDVVDVHIGQGLLHIVLSGQTVATGQVAADGL